jgi:hypothetical protein
LRYGEFQFSEVTFTNKPGVKLKQSESIFNRLNQAQEQLEQLLSESEQGMVDINNKEAAESGTDIIVEESDTNQEGCKQESLVQQDSLGKSRRTPEGQRIRDALNIRQEKAKKYLADLQKLDDMLLSSNSEREKNVSKSSLNSIFEQIKKTSVSLKILFIIIIFIAFGSEYYVDPPISNVEEQTEAIALSEEVIAPNLKQAELEHNPQDGSITEALPPVKVQVIVTNETIYEPEQATYEASIKPVADLGQERQPQSQEETSATYEASIQPVADLEQERQPQSQEETSAMYEASIQPVADLEQEKQPQSQEETTNITVSAISTNSTETPGADSSEIIAEEHITTSILPVSEPNWTIQIAAMRDKAGAKETRDLFASQGLEAYLHVKIIGEDETWYKIHFGRYKKRQQAEEARLAFLNKFKHDAFVIPFIQDQ